MLSIEEIKKEYNNDVYQKNQKAVFVEYLQYELLDSIFKQSKSSQLSFIGGTALKIVYGGGRFSEDLDFDNFGLSFKEFEDLLGESIKDMRNKGFEMDIKFVEKGAYHCYIRFPKLLFKNKLSKYFDGKILVRIDTVQKEKNIEPDIFLLDGFSIFRKIIVNPPDVILSQKLLAILGRKREKGRDLFDVSFLLAKYEPNYDYLSNFEIKGANDLKEKILRRVEEFDLKKMTNDVLPFLINPNDEDRVLFFKEYIEQKL
jgi:predicted nucleotidyltransferase component of viral defense system